MTVTAAAHGIAAAAPAGADHVIER
jgi:hypothetical protein